MNGIKDSKTLRHDLDSENKIYKSKSRKFDILIFFNRDFSLFDSNCGHIPSNY